MTSFGKACRNAFVTMRICNNQHAAFGPVFLNRTKGGNKGNPIVW